MDRPEWTTSTPGPGLPVWEDCPHPTHTPRSALAALGVHWQHSGCIVSVAVSAEGCSQHGWTGSVLCPWSLQSHQLPQTPSSRASAGTAGLCLWGTLKRVLQHQRSFCIWPFPTWTHFQLSLLTSPV